MTINLSEEQKIKLLNSGDVYRVMREILLREEKIDQEKEHFWMIGLANTNMILYIELVSLGSASEVVVEPMNVYRVAVLKGAVKVIFIHNHPTGELNPSADDKDVTDRLIQVGRILNIEAIDHLIISTTSYLSFGDTGLFEELKRSTKWVPQYELIARVKAEEKIIREMAVSEAVKETEVKATRLEKLATAKRLKRKNTPLDLIIEATGLTEEEIKGIQ
jgi:DNA repair protein RadC